MVLGKLPVPGGGGVLVIWIIQSNFNGSNIFGTMQICSRQG